MFVAFAVRVFVMFVPDAVFEFTCSRSVKLAVLFTARLEPSVHVIVPVPPTGGSVPQVHPAGGVIDWNVVLGGVTSVMLAPVAAAGPMFLTVCVYVTLLPAETEVGVAVLVATKSACVANATTSEAVAVLFAAFGSVIDELTFTDWLMAVPAAVPAVTVTM